MLEALRHQLSAYVNFTDEEFDYFSQHVEVRSFEKKQQLTKIGQMENYMNFVLKGLAMKYFLKGKEPVVVQIAKEFDVIYAKNSFELGQLSLYIVETIEPTIFASISKENLEKMFKHSHQVERLGRRIIIDCYLQKESWEYDRMNLNTRERFVQFMRNNSDLLQRVPQKILASYLNIKPETFSRLKHLLQKKK
ncbi:MAG: Crp/Fnr family transcriptional regulator [Bacteroidetes bacterium]|nr:Crp/Fnr family transcriptional regulator [Bacteroidota bacterium]